MANPKVYIYIVTVFTLLTASSAAVALEMSSKRNCAVCHIMWLDDFRTDKETLIEWQPGNVLMKDTQGVVSSEAICYSCHDGYVVDSRSETWTHNGHKTFISPSKKIAIPPDLPLSNKNEIYCGTCHTPHSGAANTDASLSGPISFLRKDNIDSNLCEVCHTKQAAFGPNNGHPVKIKSDGIPEVLFQAGGRKSKSRNKVICQTCHKVHGGRGDKILVMENRSSELCRSCHQRQGLLIRTKHDLRISLPDEKNMKGERPSESGPCGACHLPHGAAGRRLWARRPLSGDPASQPCLACHGEDSGLRAKRIGQHSHPIGVLSSSDKTVSSKWLPLFLQDGTRDPAGRVQCFTCHEVHRWDPDNPGNSGGKKVEGDASNSFLRISSGPASNLCIACHKDKEQLITSDHNLEVTAPEERNLQQFTTRASGPCGACHIPHNAAGKRMWAKPLSAEKDFISQVCDGCHDKNGAAKAKLIGENYHPVNLSLRETKIRGMAEQIVRDLPLHGENDDKILDDRITCVTCHDPHQWDPARSEPLENYPVQNMEGNATNSFLRKGNFPSPELCKICHVSAARVEGTPHDLPKTAPESRNLLGQAAEASDSCGPCHSVHNAPKDIKLWARAYGPIPENGSFMDGLCTSCHSRGHVAEKKIPPVVTHPPGKAITNAMRFNKDGRASTPLFDLNGKEKIHGDLSCPSCHNVHVWSPLLGEMTTGDQGNFMRRFRFLRNMSYDTVCVDCHGHEAILRYLYFHIPEKRSKR